MRADPARPGPAVGIGSGQWDGPFYRLYGITLASRFRFANRLPRTSGPEDVRFTLIEGPSGNGVVPGASLLFETPPNSRGERLVQVYAAGSEHIIRYTDVADYHLADDRIVCRVIDPAYAYALEIYLLGTVMSLWLERRARPALHASAVALGERAIAFLAGNKGGKSTLAAALMRAGHPLLTDDILALDLNGPVPVGQPGYPQMRMWPAEAARFLGRSNGLERVHPDVDKRRVPVGAGGLGRFCESARPLGAIYLPRRRPPGAGTEIEIAEVPAHQAVIELLRASFVPNMASALGWAPRRLDQLSDVVRRVPVRRLTYPAGFEHLERVRDRILADVMETTA